MFSCLGHYCYELDRNCVIIRELLIASKYFIICNLFVIISILLKKYSLFIITDKKIQFGIVICGFLVWLMLGVMSVGLTRRKKEKDEDKAETKKKTKKQKTRTTIRRV